MAEYDEPEVLVGRKGVMVTNLARRKTRGLESQGMLPPAEADGTVTLLQPHRDLLAGADPLAVQPARARAGGAP